MTSSSCLLPSELMLSLTDEWWRHPSQCKPPYTLPSPTQRQLDHLDILAVPSCSSGLPYRPYRQESDVPDLSHTPFSCDSNLSGSVSMSLESPSDLGSACYMPDMDALQSTAFDPCVSQCCPHELSLPSFPCTAMESTIHSPMPVFAYKTFDFDYDCPPSPRVKSSLRTEHVDTSRHKRHREDENAFEDHLSPKRRKMSSEALRLLPPFRLSPDLPPEWHPCNPVDAYQDTFSMEKLLNCSFDWGDATWPKLPDH